MSIVLLTVLLLCGVVVVRYVGFDSDVDAAGVVIVVVVCVVVRGLLC